MFRLKKYIIIALILMVIYVFPLPLIFPPYESKINAIYQLTIGVLMLIGYIFYIVGDQYHRISGRNFWIDFFRPDRTNDIISLFLDAIAEKKEINQTMADLPNCSPYLVTGIVFGKNENGRLVCSPEDEDLHIAVFGRTGSGKTSAVLIPTLRAWEGAVFAIDIAGDLVSNAGRHDLFVLDIENPSVKYDVFKAVRSAPRDEQLEQLAMIAYTLIPDPTGEDNENSRYFRESGRSLFQAALIYGFDEEWNFAEICRKFKGTDVERLIRNIWNNDKSPGQDAALLIAGFRGANEKNTNGAKQAADAAISFFATNHAMQELLSGGSGDLTPDMIERKDIFVKIPESKLTVYAPFLRLITTQMLNYLSSRPVDSEKPVLLAIDEFARLGRFDGFLDTLRIIRRHHVRVMILTQSLIDLDLVYGEKQRKAIIDNMGYRVVLSALDPATQELFSSVIGEYRRKKISKSWGGSNKTYTETSERERILLPAELGRLDQNRELLLLAPTGWVILKRNYYYF